MTPIKRTACQLLLCSLLLAGCSQTAPVVQPAPPPTPAAPASATPTLELSAEQQQQFAQAKQLLMDGNASAARRILQPLSVALPQATGVAYNLALSQWHSADIAAAQNTLSQLLSWAPLYSEGHNLAGVLARQQGQFRQAEQHFLQALQAQPDNAMAHKNLAFLYELYLGAPLQAHFHYKHYVELTQDEQAKVWLALLEQQLAQEQNND